MLLYCGKSVSYTHLNVYPAGGPEVVTSGGSGFGIMAILSGIDRGYVSRQEAVSYTHLDVYKRQHP